MYEFIRCKAIIVLAVLYTPVLAKYSLRIKNGTEGSLKYPYVVCLKIENNLRICTGFLVTSRWAMSAAHCLLSVVKYIQYGNLSLSLSQTESKRNIIKKIRHPNYLSQFFMNDIGFMLVESVPMSHYGSLAALDYKALLGLPVEYAGFGSTVIFQRESRQKMKQFILDTIRPLQIGSGVVKPCEYLLKGMLCVSPKCSNAQITLGGDSGGPLFLDQKIIGLVCGGPNDNFQNSDRYFTPISPHLSWIHKIVSLHPT